MPSDHLTLFTEVRGRRILRSSGQISACAKKMFSLALNAVGKRPNKKGKVRVAKNDPSDKKDPPKPLSLPVYGNYCGTGHGDPTFQKPPVDAVDLVCREHDRCYGLLGDFDERCDRNLVEMMPNAIAITPSPLGKQVGLLMLLYFSLAERNLGLGEILFKGD
jgi:hypothetical protein